MNRLRQMKNFILLPVLCVLFILGDLNISMSSDALDVFLNPKNMSEQRKAFLEILKSEKNYSAQVQRKLEAFQKTKDSKINVLNRLLYLAAIIKSDKFVEPSKTLGTLIHTVHCT